MPATQGKFVDRFEEAIMQFVILEKARQQGSVTKENVKSTFTGNLQMKRDHVDHCLDLLVQENHLRQEGNKYTITDDGREDVQELQRLAMEIPNVVSQGGVGGRPQQGVTPQKGAGGTMGGGTMGGAGGPR